LNFWDHIVILNALLAHQVTPFMSHTVNQFLPCKVTFICFWTHRTFSLNMIILGMKETRRNVRNPSHEFMIPHVGNEAMG
jgi:hypothetical protein